MQSIFVNSSSGSTLDASWKAPHSSGGSGQARRGKGGAAKVSSQGGRKTQGVEIASSGALLRMPTNHDWCWRERSRGAEKRQRGGGGGDGGRRPRGVRRVRGGRGRRRGWRRKAERPAQTAGGPANGEARAAAGQWTGGGQRTTPGPPGEQAAGWQSPAAGAAEQITTAATPSLGKLSLLARLAGGALRIAQTPAGGDQRRPRAACGGQLARQEGWAQAATQQPRTPRQLSAPQETHSPSDFKK